MLNIGSDRDLDRVNINCQHNNMLTKKGENKFSTILELTSDPPKRYVNMIGHDIFNVTGKYTKRVTR